MRHRSFLRKTGSRTCRANPSAIRTDQPGGGPDAGTSRWRRRRADDLVVSDRLASLFIAQLAENPSVRGVLDELFGFDGALIELHPAGAYLSAKAGPFATSVAAARARGCAAIGYRRADGQVVVNP